MKSIGKDSLIETLTREPNKESDREGQKHSEELDELPDTVVEMAHEMAKDAKYGIEGSIVMDGYGLSSYARCGDSLFETYKDRYEKFFCHEDIRTIGAPNSSGYVAISTEEALLESRMAKVDIFDQIQHAFKEKERTWLRKFKSKLPTYVGQKVVILAMKHQKVVEVAMNASLYMVQFRTDKQDVETDTDIKIVTRVRLGRRGIKLSRISPTGSQMVMGYGKSEKKDVDMLAPNTPVDEIVDRFEELMFKDIDMISG